MLTKHGGMEQQGSPGLLKTPKMIHQNQSVN